MQTQRFGTLDMQGHVATLPATGGLTMPAILDTSEAAGDAAALAGLVAFLDQLPDHVGRAKEPFIEGYDGIAPDVPFWLADEAPDAYAASFPGAADPMQVTPEDCWNALRIRKVWSAETTRVIVDLGFADPSVDHTYQAHFLLDGTLEMIEFFH